MFRQIITMNVILACQVGRQEATVLTPNPITRSGLMAVADAGEVMPPEPTWFEPKLANVLVIHMLG